MPNRRQMLQAGLGTGALFLPLPYAWVWAQSEGALKLLKAPKVALVVGNGKYKDAPELKNAPNDARAIAEVLKASGFATTMLLDTGRDALIQAIRDYVNGMEKQKAVGLFYFAGHGVQLDWRNYMLPIDAVIDKVEDVAKQSVDVARLMEGLTKAANPMNVIILDACRENPFGTAKPVAQKGLSQMDAPTQTILAYATSPGNVASDGDGANGLYTENLLREMKVPEAKIEDVFKRVRLGVRRTSKGAQIPWESTSLEEDFWFIPPKELKKISDAEKDRLFKQELALWERVREAKEPGPFEDYLRRHPSGDFAELAQLQLDRLLAKQGEKKIQIASSEGNPYTKGSAPSDTDFKVGDSYVFRRLDLYSKAEQARTTQTVERVTDTEVTYSGGLVTDLLGNVRRFPDGRTSTDGQNVPLEFAIGKHWTSRFIGRSPKGEAQFEYHFRVVAREPVTVPAGSFNAFRLQMQGFARSAMGQMDVEFKHWYDPQRLRLPVAREEVRRVGGRVVEASRFELMSYKQA
jgi:hypothetical protein